MNQTYLSDFNLWIERTTQLLQEHRWHEIDVVHLIEEIEDLGKSERRAIASKLILLLLHLLTLITMATRTPSWALEDMDILKVGK